MLPDEVLLSIFDFCVDEDPFAEGKNSKKETEAWQLLVHVCRQWRNAVFGSPRRLNLRLFCTGKTPAKDMLDIWPALPILVYGFRHYLSSPTEGMDNILAALKHSNRIHKIELVNLYSPQLEKVLETMQDSFPKLTELRLWSNDETTSVIPDSFLGGSALRLRLLWLKQIPFPGLPKLLLSATHLVELYLEYIPHSGYISPEVIVTALSTLTSLKSFFLGFQSPRSRPDRESRRPPLQTRTVLPALTHLTFKGASDYSEVFMAHIDTPRLYSLYITFTDQNIFGTPQFGEFISRTPMSKGFEKAWVAFEDDEFTQSRVNLSSQTSGYRVLDVKISCGNFDLQFSSLKQFCSSSLPSLSVLEDLHMSYMMYRSSSDSHSNSEENFNNMLDHIENTVTIYNIENSRWLELLHPFSTAKNLYLSEQIIFMSPIVPALEELVGSRITEVLPTLQNIFLEWPLKVPEGIEQFVAARQTTTHPIAVSRWNRNSK